MDNFISYHGWVGHNNIGDEAIYIANKKLFQNYEIIPKKYMDNNSKLDLFGGGTIWPLSTNYKFQNISASIGVGVKNPEFYNRKYSLLDKGYYIHRLGLSDLTGFFFWQIWALYPCPRL